MEVAETFSKMWISGDIAPGLTCNLNSKVSIINLHEFYGVIFQDEISTSSFGQTNLAAVAFPCTAPSK